MLKVWVCPIPNADVSAARPVLNWGKYVQTAWAVHPRLALGLTGRFPATNSIENELFSLISKNAMNPCIQALPRAGIILATCDPMKRLKVAPKWELLKHWAPACIPDALGLMAADTGRHQNVKAFIVTSLSKGNPEEVPIDPVSVGNTCDPVGVLSSPVGTRTETRQRPFNGISPCAEGISVMDLLSQTNVVRPATTIFYSVIL